MTSWAVIIKEDTLSYLQCFRSTLDPSLVIFVSGKATTGPDLPVLFHYIQKITDLISNSPKNMCILKFIVAICSRTHWLPLFVSGWRGRKGRSWSQVCLHVIAINWYTLGPTNLIRCHSSTWYALLHRTLNHVLFSSTMPTRRTK